MRRTEKRVIGEYTYEITQLGVYEGAAMIKRIAPVLAASGSESRVDLAKAFDGLDLKTVIEPFAKSTWVSRGNVRKLLSEVADEHFAGEYMALFEWLQACVEINYAPFLKELAEKVKGAAAPGPASASTSPTERSGSSGAP